MSSITNISLTTRMGFEPTTSAVTGRRSNQLSHRAIFNKSLYPQNQILKIFTSAALSSLRLRKNHFHYPSACLWEE